MCVRCVGGKGTVCWCLVYTLCGCGVGVVWERCGSYMGEMCVRSVGPV